MELRFVLTSRLLDIIFNAPVRKLHSAVTFDSRVEVVFDIISNTPVRIFESSVSYYVRVVVVFELIPNAPVRIFNAITAECRTFRWLQTEYASIQFCAIRAFNESGFGV